MDMKTPLYDEHVAAGGKMVSFAGWQLPVEYASGVKAEHTAVRTEAGLFDVSHMGEVEISGPDALECVNHLITRDIANLAPGVARYALLLNKQGGVIDDVLVYCFSETHYILVVNAANTDKDFAWMSEQLTSYLEEHAGLSAEIKNLSANYAQLALQGPQAHEILESISEGELPKKYYHFVSDANVAGECCWVSRSGYTGEAGYEIYCKPDQAAKLWHAILAAGKDKGLIPCGLAARDTLRLEAGMPLYGHEMNEEILPFEAGLDLGLSMDKADFIGKDALVKAQEAGITRAHIGLVITGRGIVREGCSVYVGENLVGKTTSGTYLPTCGYSGAMALVDLSAAPKDAFEEGSSIFVEVRGRKLDARVEKLPFYSRRKK